MVLPGGIPEFKDYTKIHDEEEVAFSRFHLGEFCLGPVETPTRKPSVLDRLRQLLRRLNP